MLIDNEDSMSPKRALSMVRIVPIGKVRNFTYKDMLVTLDQPKKSWDRKDRPKNTHVGQLKLLAAELAFLLKFQTDLNERTLVYAGAASGHHMRALAYLFPKLQMHLYDPAPFDVKETETIHIHKSLFTEDIANYWSTKEGVLFVSDIRSTGEDEKEFEDEIHKNMMMQKNWVETIKPERYSLKFRIPYTIVENNEDYPYLDGVLIYQAFPKVDSMEMRLIGGKDDVSKPEVLYKSGILEKVLFYHNSVIRQMKEYFSNVVTENKTPYSEKSGFYRDYDSTYYLYLCNEYLNMYKDIVKEKDAEALGIKLLHLTFGTAWSLKKRRAKA